MNWTFITRALMSLALLVGALGCDGEADANQDGGPSDGGSGPADASTSRDEGVDAFDPFVPGPVSIVDASFEGYQALPMGEWRWTTTNAAELTAEAVVPGDTGVDGDTYLVINTYNATGTSETVSAPGGEIASGHWYRARVRADVNCGDGLSLRLLVDGAPASELATANTTIGWQTWSFDFTTTTTGQASVAIVVAAGCYIRIDDVRLEGLSPL